MKKNYITAAFFGLAVTSVALSQASQNMSLLGQWNDANLPTLSGWRYNDVWGFEYNGREYGIIGSVGKVHFIDVTDPANATEVAGLAGSPAANSLWRDMKTYDQYAYAVTEGSEGLRVFDLSGLPATVTQVHQSTTHFQTAHNIFIDGANARLYVAGARNGATNVDLIIFDLSTPASPTHLASLQLAGDYIHDIYVEANIGFCSHGYNGLYIYDFTNALAPEDRGSIVGYPQSGYNHSSWKSGNTFVFADEVPQGKPLKITQLNWDPLNEVYTAGPVGLFSSNLLNLPTPSSPHNPFIVGNICVVSYYFDGVQVFDISDPDNVARVAYYDTYPANVNYPGCCGGNWGVYPFLPSGRILAADQTGGLMVLELSSSALPVRWGEIEARCQPEGLELQWTTLAETDNAGFWIERQAEGQATFQSIGFMPPAAHEGRRTYRFTDKAPLPGWNHYRIRQQDHDGSIRYSAIRAARCTEAAEQSGAGVIYPNPIRPGAAFDIRGAEPVATADLQWQWTDAYGRVVARHASHIAPAGLPAGCYALRGFSPAGELRYALKACISND